MEQLSLNDIAINKHTLILLNMGCKVAVLTPDGRLLGNAEFKNFSAKTKKIREFAYGELIEYAKPFFAYLKIGQSAKIPLENYPMKSMSSTVTSYCTRTWGHDSYVSRQHDDSLEILRLL